MKSLKRYLDLRKLTELLATKFALVLWLVLALVLLGEAWVIKGSLDKILKANDNSQVGNAQVIRVNFSLYDVIEKRLIDNQTYLPPEPTTRDPFGVK